ncbi:MAG: hypothetical protein HY689_15530 [Chloroflexi bacterium]|nr:hypothetical protein [Chloroflexota bacterium]
MSTVRRLYFFTVAFVALHVAAIGAVNLLSTLVRPLVEPQALLGDSDFLRDQVAFGISQVVVAFPIWLVHWLALQRAALQGPEDAQSRLQAFFLHLVLAAAALVGLFQSIFLLRSLLSYPLGLGAPAALLAIIRALGWLAVYGAIWAYHRPLAGRLDLRPGERTIWRWYVYVLSGFGLGMFAYGVGSLLHHELDYLLTQGHTALIGSGRAAFARHLTSHVPEVLVGGLWWLFFWRHTAVSDAGARLRQVYVFLALSIGLAGALFGLSWVLYEGLRFLFGYRAASGVEQAHFLASALPFLLVGGALWGYHQRALAAETSDDQRLAAAPGRIYFYFVAAVGLLLLAVGLANLLDIFLEFAFRQVFLEIGAGVGWWRDQLSRALVEALVGLPLWWTHWLGVQRAAVARPGERQTLPRRLYLYGVLLVSVLVVLLSMGVVLYELLRMLLGEPLTHRLLGGMLSALGYALIAGMLVGYHWQVARADLGVAAPSGPRAVRKRVLVLLAPQQRPLVPDLEAALGVSVEVLEQVAPAGGETAGKAPSPEEIQALAEAVHQAPSDRVLVFLRPDGAEVYPFK